jgi:endonuclease/exonuclease/phosphatase (EEP) superfamily protein YafD
MRQLAARGVTALVVLAGIPTVFGLLDRWTPYLEITGFFRLQYAVVLGCAAVAAAALRSFRVALAALLLVVLNVVVIARVPPAPAAAVDGSSRLRFLVANVEYGNQDHDRLARLVDEVDPDVVALTELTPTWVRALSSALADHAYRRLAPQDGAYGVGLFSRVKLRESRIERLPAGGSPTIIATVAIGARPLAVVVTHVHTPFAGDRRTRQLHALAVELRNLGKPAAVCGDFNAAPWSQSIHELAQSADLRSTYGRFGLAATWPADGSRLFRVPLDNCLVNESVAVADRRVGPDIGSDHLPLIVDLAWRRSAD